jgi:hypothetical protein
MRLDAYNEDMRLDAYISLYIYLTDKYTCVLSAIYHLETRISEFLDQKAH